MNTRRSDSERTHVKVRELKATKDIVALQTESRFLPNRTDTQTSKRQNVTNSKKSLQKHANTIEISAAFHHKDQKFPKNGRIVTETGNIDIKTFNTAINIILKRWCTCWREINLLNFIKSFLALSNREIPQDSDKM